MWLFLQQERDELTRVKGRVCTSKLQVLFPSSKQFGSRPHITETVLRNLQESFLPKESPDVKSGNAVGLRTVDAEGLAVKIETELSKRSVVRQLIEQVAVNRVIISVRHQIAGRLNLEDG
jgi:hypothetical protein